MKLLLLNDFKEVQFFFLMKTKGQVDAITLL